MTEDSTKNLRELRDALTTRIRSALTAKAQELYDATFPALQGYNAQELYDAAFAELQAFDAEHPEFAGQLRVEYARARLLK